MCKHDPLLSNRDRFYSGGFLLKLKKLLLFVTVLLLLPLFASSTASFSPGLDQAQFLNDRIREITGADLLNVPGFIAPAGLTGHGQVVAVADSGLDKGSVDDIHPDLAGDTGKKPRIIMLKSWAGRLTVDDPIGHGTHMAGTIVGNGMSSEGKFRGVAPDASIYFQGILDNDGRIVPPADVEKLFLPAYQANARVHVNAWGTGGNKYVESVAKTDAFVRAYPDFLVIFGAGNSGPGTKSLTSEANSKNALVVGASVSPRPALDFSPAGTMDRAQFSSRGPSGDGRIKPDLLAPGTSIISTRSSLVSGNMPGYPLYTRMQGTSMAAAVAAGSAALLRQYMQSELVIADPLAASVKAALINGARTTETGPSLDGFGVLDLAGTVLALKERTMLLSEEKLGLPEGVAKTYKYKAEESGSPLKITIAWTDPAGGVTSPKALVNNLDLTVTDPDGRKYLGNDFLNQGPDMLNNVEQVYIRNPLPGEYTIEVRAVSVTESAVSGKAVPQQDYSLAYGQMLSTGIVNEVNKMSGKLIIAGIEELNTSNKKIKIFLNGDPGSLETKDMSEGLRVYVGKDNNLYFAGRIWNPPGVKVVQTSKGILWADVGFDQNEGGYYQAEQGKMTINGTLGGNIRELPPGVTPISTVDPVTQKIWNMTIDYRVREGIIYSLEGSDNKTLRFVGDGSTYKIADNAIYMNSYDFSDTDPFLSAFGPDEMKNLGGLQPGVKVKAIINPAAREIRSIIVNRQVVSGFVAGVDRGKHEIILDNGKRYKLLEGVKMFRDDRPVKIDDLKAGDVVSAILLPQTDTMLGLVSYSSVMYGQIIYFSEGDRTVYFNGVQNRFKLYGVKENLEVYRRGARGSLSDLSSGAWAKAVIDPESGNIKRIYIAEWIDQLTGKILEINESAVTFKDGSKYLLSPVTTFLKDGNPVTYADFLPGEEVSYTPLLGAGGKNVVAYLGGSAGSEEVRPKLKYVAMPLDQYYLVSGVTGGDIVYFWRGSGSRAEVIPNNRGEFTYTFVPAPGEETVRLVSVDRKKGAVNGRLIYVPPQVEKKFTDIGGHWAEQAVTRLAGRGIAVGYSDSSFRPDRPITREELAVLAANALGLRDGEADLQKYMDRGAISPWARSGVGALTARGLLEGFSDGNFKPRDCVTRSELAVVMEKISSITLKASRPAGAPPIGDWDSVPSWARDPVERVYMAGILKGMPGEIFAPFDRASRAEAAVALYRIIELIEKG